MKGKGYQVYTTDVIEQKEIRGNDRVIHSTHASVERELALNLMRFHNTQRCGGGRRIIRKKIGGV